MPGVLTYSIQYGALRQPQFYETTRLLTPRISESDPKPQGPPGLERSERAEGKKQRPRECLGSLCSLRAKTPEACPFPGSFPILFPDLTLSSRPLSRST